MIYTNHLEEAYSVSLSKELFEPFIQLLAPFAPHLAEELREKLGHDTMLYESRGWPQYDEQLLIDDVITMAVQINGKMRGTIEVSPDASQDEVLSIIQSDEKFAGHFV